MMRICYINPTFLVRRPIAELIRNFSEMDDVSLFIPKKPFQKIDMSWHNNSSLKKAKIYSYSAINIPLLNFEWPIPITPMFLINLFKVFRKNKVIHMWTYFYINSFMALFLKKFFFRKKRLILSADTFPAYSFKSGKLIDTLFLIYTNLFKSFLFKTPNLVHTYGQSMIGHAKKAGAKNVVVIPTGIHLEKFSNVIKVNRSNLGLSEDDIIIIFAGLLVPRKGIDVMLKVVKSLSKDYDNIKLILVGGGHGEENYQNLAKKFGIGSKVLFLGWRQDIPSLLNMADILMLPSRGEGLPGIVMEAMAAELPIVASNIPCIPDLVENDKNGFLCEMNNVSDFKEKIELLVTNKQKRLVMGQRSKQMIQKSGWENLISKYRSLYQ